LGNPPSAPILARSRQSKALTRPFANGKTAGNDFAARRDLARFAAGRGASRLGGHRCVSTTGYFLDAFAENRLHVVTVRIDYERSVIAGRITFSNVAEPGRTVIDSSGVKGGRVESIDLPATPRNECRVLLDTVRAETIDPEDWVFHPIADPISAFVRGGAA
jgi:hypothetical protein